MLADMEGAKGSMLLLCLLSIISLTKANTSPDITQVVYNVCEDTPKDAFAFTIKAEDEDDDPLTFALVGVNAGYFRVEENTGRVFVHRELDTQPRPVMMVDAEVFDGFNTRRRPLNILLLEANNNIPIFEEPSYDYSMPENTRVGTSLFRVKAEDDDSGLAGVVTYSIDEVNPSSGFNLFNITNGTGEVRLTGNLNYTELSSFYRLKINATDGGGSCYFNVTEFHSSVVYSFITVVDVPDLDPEFMNDPYRTSVKEHAPLGQSVFQVTAIDPDIGVNDEIIFSIEASTAEGLFAISNDGVISVLSDIDREELGENDTIILTVKATESKPNIHGLEASTSTTVDISIIDINDNKPEFYKCGSSCSMATDFTGEVLENSLSSVNINMTVKDLDKFSNTILTLEGTYKDVFSVQPSFTTVPSIVQLSVQQPQELDYEKTQQMVLQVIATDRDNPTFQSIATVTIHIMDVNDNSPTFPEPTYTLYVPEHSDVGTVVANITAVDPDTMDQGKLTYRLLPESIQTYFSVEKYAGIVTVKNKPLLDREVRSLYSVTLEARDSENKPGTTVLEIIVTDINDQPPVINRDSYQGFVKEGEQLEITIQATDADDPDTDNSKIVYSIEESRYSDNFTIDPDTGVLKNSGELDREALDPELRGKIELNVTATDKGTPPLFTKVKVVIDVEDVNDNAPQFDALSYQFFVKEGEKGAFVGSVTAEDLDQTVGFNRISFSIIDGSFGSFIIRTYAMERGYMGNITVDPDIELDYESDRKQFRLRVEALDLEQERAEVMVDVNVLDVNDERPEFKSTAPVTVKENTTISEAVGRFTAEDKDGNHSLVYELVSMKCRCNASLTPCSYFVLDQTGEVRVNPEITVDYEQCDQVLIEAQVVDEFTEKGQNNSVNTGLMEINIEDINDNAPEFIDSGAVFVVVSESASKGTSVAEVSAKDRDSGINQQIEFRVTEVQFADTNNQTVNQRLLFEAVTTQQKDIYVGIIQSTEGLDVTLKGKYLVTVTATDSGGLSTNTVLEIFTVDETFKVELAFQTSVEETEKNQNAIVSKLISATKAAVEIVSMRPETPEDSRAEVGTIIVAYFVYSNGTALTSEDVEKMISDPEHYLALESLGLKNIGVIIEPVESDPLKYVLLGILGGLIIVLAVLTTSLMCTRRTYRRKLKAAKAMNSANMVTSENQKGGALVPGTNIYTKEGANPVLNLNIENSLVLDLDTESSDVDKVSLNSLDCSDNVRFPNKDTKPFMNMIHEEEEDEEERGDPPEFIEPLGAVLAQRGPKVTENPLMGYNNPAFSTTDL